VTLVGSVASVLGEPGTLGLSESQIGAAASFYLLGAVIGALYFGRLTDRLGRKRLFLVTLALYLTATLMTAFSWNFTSFVIFRMITGADFPINSSWSAGGEFNTLFIISNSDTIHLFNFLGSATFHF
jgi:predicted MFS family arabinose efflux permease